MHSWRNTSFSINLYFCSKFLCQNVDRNINIKCKTFHEDAGEPRQVQGWLGCLWKGLDIRVTTQWEDHKMDGPHPTPTPHKQNQCFIQNLSQRIWRTKAGTRVIGVSMERSWPQSHHTIDGPLSLNHHPTPTPLPPQKHKINVMCKTCPEEPGKTKAGTRVIGVSMERYWPKGHHKMDGPPTLPHTSRHTHTQNQY